VPGTDSHLKEFEFQVDVDNKEKKPYQIEKFRIFDAPFHFRKLEGAQGSSTRLVLQKVFFLVPETQVMRGTETGILEA
jgi:hypothetical protein